MDINSLLNPAGESHIMTETTDTDIYQAVMDAIEARENMEKNGGDNVDEDGPATSTSTIGNYLTNWNDPLARQLETLLGAVSRQLRIDEAKSMKNTVLTDFYRVHSTNSD
ncbi:hypothetical protein EDB83DRAFT_2232711 [Lactarius deliciosus]|nr:hypothetical protein EDB83DRAFT_2232711 [Lactarius deliciosus]